MNYIKILNQIIYNTYNICNNNYFSSININILLASNYQLTKINFKNDIIDIYPKIKKIKNEKEIMDKKINNDNNKNKFKNCNKFLENDKYSFFLSLIFSHLDEKRKLELVKYNKKLQNKININLINYNLFSNKYIIYESKEKVKCYDDNYDKIIYEGE